MERKARRKTKKTQMKTREKKGKTMKVNEDPKDQRCPPERGLPRHLSCAGEVSPLEIPRALVMRLFGHAESCLPEEACGVVAAGADGFLRYFPTQNATGRSDRFRFDPVRWTELFFSLQRRRFDLCALFHSHPQSAAVPSNVDLEDCTYPHLLHLIAGKGPPGKGLPGGQFLVPSLRAFVMKPEVAGWREIALTWREG